MKVLQESAEAVGARPEVTVEEVRSAFDAAGLAKPDDLAIEFVQERVNDALFRLISETRWARVNELVRPTVVCERVQKALSAAKTLRAILGDGGEVDPVGEVAFAALTNAANRRAEENGPYAGIEPVRSLG